MFSVGEFEPGAQVEATGVSEIEIAVNLGGAGDRLTLESGPPSGQSDWSFGSKGRT